MTDRDDDEEPADRHASAAKSELLAALGHLKNAADLLVGAADPAMRKAKEEAQRVLHQASAEAQPIARQLGAELERISKSLQSALEGRRKSEPPAKSAEESEVERLEREAERKR